MKETNQYGQRRLIVKSDLLYNFVTSPVTVIAAFLTFVIVFSAVFAPFLTPHDPFNPGTLELRGRPTNLLSGLREESMSFH